MRGTQVPSFLAANLLVTSHLFSHLALALLPQVTPWGVRVVWAVVAEDKAKQLLRVRVPELIRPLPAQPPLCRQEVSLQLFPPDQLSSYLQLLVATPRHCPKRPSFQALLQGRFFLEALPDVPSEVTSPTALPLISLDF